MINIRGRKISNITKSLIIAEIGINHFGSLDLAKKIVDQIKAAGAEAVKVQIHIPDEEMSKECLKIKPGNSNKSIYKIIEENSLSLDDELKLKNYIKKKKLIYIATPFSFKAARWLNDNNVDIFKVGSGECNNLPLVEYISSFKKPMIVSTGMNSLNEVKKTYRILLKYNVKHVLMHCVNLYPTPYKLSRISRFKNMFKKFKKSLIGYSDHTVGIEICKIAISLGASVIEKHFTFNKNVKGPDISSSMDKNELKDLLRFSNIFYECLQNKKELIAEENITRNFAFHSVVSSNHINVGERFNAKNITIKRPGTGDFSANEIKKLYGKVASRKIEPNRLIKKNDIQK